MVTAIAFAEWLMMQMPSFAGYRTYSGTKYQATLWSTLSSPGLQTMEELWEKFNRENIDADFSQ